MDSHFQEIARNYVFIKPLVIIFNDRVPGCIVLTDIWLYLNRLLDYKLLRKPDLPVQTQAAQEASRCKRLIGSLRYLYRNSAWVFALVCFTLPHDSRGIGSCEMF